MLERVSSSAECATHSFLRCLDAPVRSHRNLGSSFWRHGNERSDIPVWWATCLNNIRNRSQNVSPEPIKLRVNTAHAVITPTSQNLRSIKHITRTLTNTSLLKQTTVAKIAPEDDAESFEGEQRTSIKIRDKNATTRRNRHGRTGDRTDQVQPPPSPSNKGLEFIKNFSLRNKWTTFIKDGCDEKQASNLLHQLAASKNQEDLDFSLRAFSLIPTDLRSANDYHTAVNAAVELGRYAYAIRIIKEAVSRSMNHETIFRFLALCVSKERWITAADLWKDVRQSAHHTLHTALRDPDSKRRNFAGRYTSQFDIVADLPMKLTRLVRRLENNDTVLAAHRDILVELCKRLVLTAAENEKVMNVITEESVMSLFATQKQLDFDSRLHFAAIATIGRMAQKGTRSQLALLIYRDCKSRFPNISLPQWIFGTLIGICSSGGHPTGVYQSLLNDYRTTYGLPTERLYFQGLRACADQGEVKETLSLFLEFCRHYAPKHADDLNPMLRAYAVTGDYRGARNQFDKLHAQFEFEPSVRNWNTLLLACVRSDQREKAYSLFEEMKRNHVEPDQYSWSILVSAASKRGDVEQARDLVRKAQAAGIRPPLAMIGALVDSCLHNQRVDEARSLVIDTTHQLSASGSRESPIRLWNSLFRYHAFKADSEAILKTQTEMKESGVRADSMTYAALMTALVVQRRTEEAIQVLHSLHLSRALSANEFHYSILIHGFAMEKKWDSALAIYREMLEKFPRATPSAKLSMLYLQAFRDEEATRTKYLAGETFTKPDFRPTLKNIRETLADITPADMASTLPNPGFRRRSSHTDLRDIYFDSLIAFLHQNDAHNSAQSVSDLLLIHQELLRDECSSSPPSWISTLTGLSHHLESCVNSHDWIKCSKIWQQIINLTLKNCTSAKSKQNSSSDHTNVWPSDMAANPLKEEAFKMPNMLPTASDLEQPPTSNTSILKAFQYVLSWQISQIIKAFDGQQKYSDLLATIRSLHGYGFALSSRNWNGLIQVLCRSSNLDHGILAFELFEKHMLPNAPSWSVIRRGKWVHPSEEKPRNFWHALNKRKDDRKDRKVLEKLDPGLLMPSYYTMVHLAVVWLKMSKLSPQSSHIKHRLEKEMPGTILLISKTPYLKDRVQGVLLRGRRVIGDRLKRPRRTAGSSSPFGVLGSRLLIDEMAPDTLATSNNSTLSSCVPVSRQGVPEAEKLLADINHSTTFLPSENRFESRSERNRRIAKAKQRRLALLRETTQQVRGRPSKLTSLVNTDIHNHASHHASAIMDSRVNRSHEFGQQQSGIYCKLNSILERTGTQARHVRSALTASNQRSAVRTTPLTHVMAAVTESNSTKVSSPLFKPVQKSVLNRRQLQQSSPKIVKSRSPTRKRAGFWKGSEAWKARQAGPKRLQRSAGLLRIKYDATKTRAAFKAPFSEVTVKRLGRRRWLINKTSE